MTATLPGINQRPTARAGTRDDDELVVDIFAGAGGASLGIEAALDRRVDVAINHSPAMVALHRLNHPHTRHYVEDVWHVPPREATGGRPVGLLWASPDCRHFSRAKGGVPVSKGIRCLAWAVVRWAREVRPRVIVLENVPEFAEWGPLVPKSDAAGRSLSHTNRATGRREPSLMPDRNRRGVTFRRWVGNLRGLGYTVEWQVLCAADYGVPTIRRRLFVVARCDGEPVVWPARTHAPRDRAAKLGLRPWRSAAECIDWSLPCPSIFLTREEGRALGVRRPLAEATLRRIAKGVRKFVLEAAEPFLVTVNHAGPEFRGQAVDEPLSTVTASRDARGLVAPVLTAYHGAKGAETRASDVGDPLPVQDASPRHALAAAFVTRFRGDNSGSSSHEPAPTITGGGNAGGRPAGAAHALGLAAAFVTRICQGGSHGDCVQPVARPLTTVVSKNEHCLTAAVLQRFRYGEVRHVDPRDPHQTICAQGNHHAVLAAHLQANNTGNGPRRPEEPLGTATSGGRHMLVASVGLNLRGEGRGGRDERDPVPAVTAGGNHVAHVRAFLSKYFGTAVGQAVDEPLHTVTGKARFGIVTIEGQDYQIIDIGMRMLRPAELLRAQFGEFADEYILQGTQAQQVAAIGNSVPPRLAQVLVEANCRLACRRNTQRSVVDGR